MDILYTVFETDLSETRYRGVGQRRLYGDRAERKNGVSLGKQYGGHARRPSDLALSSINRDIQERGKISAHKVFLF